MQSISQTPDLFDPPRGAVQLRSPCPRCGERTGRTMPGRGPHYRELRCARGHHVAWLPKVPS